MEISDTRMRPILESWLWKRADQLKGKAAIAVLYASVYAGLREAPNVPTFKMPTSRADVEQKIDELSEVLRDFLNECEEYRQLTERVDSAKNAVAEQP